VSVIFDRGVLAPGDEADVLHDFVDIGSAWDAGMNEGAEFGFVTDPKP
jgi:hypothetical protein